MYCRCNVMKIFILLLALSGKVLAGSPVSLSRSVAPLYASDGGSSVGKVSWDIAG